MTKKNRNQINLERRRFSGMYLLVNFDFAKQNTTEL